VLLLDSEEVKSFRVMTLSSTSVQKEEGLKTFEGGPQLLGLMGDVTSHADAMDNLRCYHRYYYAGS
jgi:hypothetical protein